MISITSSGIDCRKMLNKESSKLISAYQHRIKMELVEIGLLVVEEGEEEGCP